jgi:glycosyltransferase involved in cell wall biosynthesis
MNKFVFIIPFRNVKQYIKICCESLITQNNKNWKAILCDDLSNDNTLDEVPNDDRLSKYVPLINNLGYFISSAFIGSDNISFTEKTIGDIKVDEIFIEPKYDYQVDIPKVLYHTSPLKFKEKILKSGLSPRSGNKLSNHPDRIYLTNSFNKCIRFGEYLVMKN